MGPTSVELRNGERKTVLDNSWATGASLTWSQPLFSTWLVPVCTLVGENDVSLWLDEDGSTGLPHTASTCLPWNPWGSSKSVPWKVLDSHVAYSDTNPVGRRTHAWNLWVGVGVVDFPCDFYTRHKDSLDSTSHFLWYHPAWKERDALV